MSDSSPGREFHPERDRAIRAIKVLLFSASLIPATVGGAIAYAAGFRAPGPFVLVTLGLFIGQAGGDYLYYYFTHFHTDARDAHTKIFAGWRPLFTGSLLKPEQTLAAGIACLVLDLGIAAYFVWAVGPPILWFAAAGGLVAIFFTPLMLRGLKEPVVFVTFGPLCLAGVAYALTGAISVPALVSSVPLGLFITAVAYLKSARFEVADRAGDLVVLKLSRIAIAALLGLGYASLVAGIVAGPLPRWSLAGLLSLPLAVSVVRVAGGARSRVSEYLWATVRTIVISIIAGLAVALGFLA